MQQSLYARKDVFFLRTRRRNNRYPAKDCPSGSPVHACSSPRFAVRPLLPNMSPNIFTSLAFFALLPVQTYLICGELAAEAIDARAERPGSCGSCGREAL